jgi:integrase
MLDPPFKSVQAACLQDFVDLKHAQGYRYTHQRYLLHRFDRLLYERSYPNPWLDVHIIEVFQSELSRSTAFSQSKMLSALRDYSRFVHLRYPHSYVLEMPPIRVKRTLRFYVYSGKEISALMQAAARLGPPESIRPHTVKTLIGLLYVSGLRIGEALGLNVEDLDLNERTLFVRKGKFGKDRYVPLAASSMDALLRYRSRAEKLCSDQAVFVSSRGTRMSPKTIGNIFRRLLQECGIATDKPWPRLHDLRHTFAVNCLCRWYERGEDVNALLPVLSTVMGHVKVSCTQLYLHVPSQLRDTAAARFYQGSGIHVIPEKAS